MKLLLALLLSTVVMAYADSGIFCSLCTDLVTSLEDEITEDEPDIVGKANQICDNITKKNAILDPLCKQIVDSEIENIIDDLENDEKPAVICAKIKFCGSGAY